MDASNTITFGDAPGGGAIGGTITLQGDLDQLEKNITIIAGIGVTITSTPGSLAFPILRTDLGTKCEFDNLIIENPGGGGAGAILNLGTLVVNGCTITNCTGSGISNDKTLTMYNTDVEWNSSGSGGGMRNVGTATCYYCTFAHNYASSNGGGIDNETGASLTLTDCIVSNNYADLGGGIYNNSGSVTVIGPLSGPSGGPSTSASLDLAYNTAHGRGGGLYQTGSGATATFTGASIVGNLVDSSYLDGAGGGVCLEGGFANFGPWCYIVGNSAAVGASIAYKNTGASFSIDDSCTIDSAPQLF